jgi:glycosyltransferase involved in cell wall biosynthesis
MKILLVCESSYINESGGRVIRFLNKILNDEKNNVKILVLNEKNNEVLSDDFYKINNVEFLPLRGKFYNRLSNIFFNTKEVVLFKKLLKSFKPNIVHFASFENNKPAKFLTESKKIGAKVILQPWTMHFYCAQGFGFNKNEKCHLCVNGNFFKAITNDCVTIKKIPGQIERYFLKKSAKIADIVLSSNNELDNILMQYGFNSKKIFRFPIPFDYNFVNILYNSNQDYYIYYGQANEHKGINVLLNIFQDLPDFKLKIFPLSNFSDQKKSAHNIEIINGVGWGNGLKEAVMNAKAVLIPSLWSSSTEYALCEALLLKKPVIVFNVGVHKDIFINKHNAMVVEPNDLLGYKNAIIEINNNKQLRDRIAENGHNTLLDINNLERLKSDLNSIYKLKDISIS